MRVSDEEARQCRLTGLGVPASHLAADLLEARARIGGLERERQDAINAAVAVSRERDTALRAYREAVRVLGEIKHVADTAREKVRRITIQPERGEAFMALVRIGLLAAPHPGEGAPAGERPTGEGE